MTLEDFIDFCARQELDGAEVTSYYFRRTDEKYLAELRRRAHVNGLAISGTPIGCDLCLPPGEARDRQLEHVRDWVDRAAFLGAHTIRVFAGGVPRGDTEAAALDRAVDGLRESAAYAGTKGVILALENHGGITSSAAQVLALVERVASPWLGVNVDTGNFRNDVYESIARISPHAVAVQVKTEVSEQGKPAEPTDYARVVDILRRSGYRGFVALEFEGKGSAAEEVPRALELLRRAIQSK
jgi:sugar phosphate isomerase/epimerase